MNFEKFSVGSIRIDGVIYEKDVVIDHGKIRKRKEKPSKKYRDQFGHTPLSAEEEILWNCRRTQVIGIVTARCRSWNVGRTHGDECECHAQLKKVHMR